MLALVQWLNEVPISVWLREMPYPFPIIETIHILALGASFGTILWVDLRLMNVVMRDRRVSDGVSSLLLWLGIIVAGRWTAYV